MSTRRPGFGVKLDLDEATLKRAMGALSPLHLSRANSRALQSAQKALVRKASDQIVGQRFIKLSRKQLAERFGLSGSFRSDVALQVQYASIRVSSKGENWTDFSPRIVEARKRKLGIRTNAKTGRQSVRRVKAKNQKISVRIFGRYQATNAFILTGGSRPKRSASVARNTFLLKRTAKNAPRNSLEKFHMPAVADFMRARGGSVGRIAIDAARERYNAAFSRDMEARIRKGAL